MSCVGAGVGSAKSPSVRLVGFLCFGGYAAHAASSAGCRCTSFAATGVFTALLGSGGGAFHAAGPGSGTTVDFIGGAFT